MRHDTDKRFFFCVNSGRSGSEYLAELLGTAAEVRSFHEAEPTMTGDFLRMVNERPYSETIQERRVKSEAIKRIVTGFPEGETVYAETNHMFIKTFFDVVVNDLANVEVILLRRELARVLKSFIELNYFSPANDHWPLWMTSPNARTAALPCIGRDEDLDQYDLCIAYLIDIEARAQRFKKEYPHAKIHEVRIESLNSYSNVKEFFERLRITLTDETERLLGGAVNVREYRKLDFGRLIDLQYCRDRIDEYMEKTKAAGITMPPSLALDPWTDTDTDAKSPTHKDEEYIALRKRFYEAFSKRLDSSEADQRDHEIIRNLFGRAFVGKQKESLEVAKDYDMVKHLFRDSFMERLDGQKCDEHDYTMARDLFGKAMRKRFKEHKAAIQDHETVWRLFADSASLKLEESAATDRDYDAVWGISANFARRDLARMLRVVAKSFLNKLKSALRGKRR